MFSQIKPSLEREGVAAQSVATAVTDDWTRRVILREVVHFIFIVVHSIVISSEVEKSKPIQ